MRILLICAALAATSLTSCSSMYYSAMESMGYEKRHIMVDRVEDARDDQEEAKEQFKSTLDRFKELTGADGGDLERVYSALAKEFERCEGKAEDVTDRIESIEDVAEDMFEEWREELAVYTDPNLRKISERQLSDTEGRYEQMIAAMRRAEETMAPVLTAFRDQVLFLKHNLNAAMVASLQNSVVEIETDVSALIAEMEASIAEANQFIDGMPSS